MSDLIETILLTLTATFLSTAAISWLIHKYRTRTLEGRLRTLEENAKKTPPINIINTVHGKTPPIAKFTGRLYMGYSYFWKKHQTVFLPEIFIDYQDGRRELLDIEGFELPDEIGNSHTEFIGGLTVTLGPPPRDNLPE